MLPHVVVHNEMSLDARMDGLDVDMGRFYELAGTWREDCTLVGSETLLAGMPELGVAGSAVALERRDTTEHQGGGASPTLHCSPRSTRAGGCPASGSCATSRTGGT